MEPTDPVPLWIVPDGALSELRAALEDFEKYADFRLLRAARAVEQAARQAPGVIFIPHTSP